MDNQPPEINPQSINQEAQPQSPTPVIPIESVGPANKAALPKKSKLIGKIVIVVLILLLIVAGAGIYYRIKQQQKANNEFNALTNQIKQQEIISAKNYVSITNQLSKISAAHDAAVNSGNDAELKQLQTQATALTNVVKKACDQKINDLSEDQINQKVKGLWLTKNQKDFIAQKAKIIKGLDSTQFSSTGSCSDGTSLVSLYKNTVNIDTGLASLNRIIKDPASLDAQLAKLKKFVGYKLSDEASLQAKLPETTRLLNDIGTLLSDSYYAFQAEKAGNLTDALKFSQKMDKDSASFDTDQKNSDNELKSLDKENYDAIVVASNKEVAIWQKYSSYKFNDVGTELSAYRIASAALDKYADAHNYSYPAGKTAKDLVDVTGDDNLAILSTKKLLGGLSYASLGEKRTGFTLSVTLNDGTKLNIKYEPVSTTSI